MIKLVIFDWKRTLFDPDRKKLIPGALELLKSIKNKEIPMILIGKGGGDMQEEVDRLKVRNYFQQIIFAEGDKDPQVFIPFMSKNNPKETILIGDRVRSELLIGNQLGATTIWVKQGKFAAEEPEVEEQQPNYTVLNLVNCLKLFKKLSTVIEH